MRILFVQTNTYALLNPFPMGASLVAARLARAGHEVRFVDLMREPAPLDVALAAARSFAPELACYSIRNRDNMDPRRYLDPMPCCRFFPASPRVPGSEDPRSRIALTRGIDRRWGR